MKIAIVGGGLAGISAARHALSRGCKVEIFESGNKFGGRLAHVVDDSCVIDQGFQVVNVHYPELKKLLSRKDIKSKPLFTALNFMDEGGKRRDLSPFNIASVISPASGSVLEKLRFVRFLASKSSPSQNLDIESTKFPILYERLLKPFLSGVFLSDPGNIRGDIVKRILRYFLLGKPHLIDGGVGNLITVLMRDIPAQNMHLNSRVTRLEVHPTSQQLTLHIQGHDSQKTYENFDYVVIATNGKPGEIAGTSGGNSRSWVASTTVYHKIKKLPGRNRKLFLGSTFVNSLIISDANGSYCDAQNSLIATTYLGDYSEDAWRNERETLEQEIVNLYDCKVSDLKLTRIEFVSNSLPFFGIPNPGTDSAAIIDPTNSRIVYAGDSFDEPSQNGALRSGRVAIKKILDSVN